MNGYNFTDRVRRVLQLAREEAARLHHQYVGTEHILLGLIREGEGVGVAVLTNLNVDLEEISRRIEETVKKGGGWWARRPRPPLHVPGEEGSRVLDERGPPAEPPVRGDRAPAPRRTAGRKRHWGAGLEGGGRDRGGGTQRGLAGARHQRFGGFGHNAARSTARPVHARRAGKSATRLGGGA